MPLENERFFTSRKKRFLCKSIIFLYSVFSGVAVSFLFGVYLFSQRYQSLHHSSLETKKRVVVSLSQFVKPVSSSVSSLPPSRASASVSGQLKNKNSIITKVFERFFLASPDYVLAQIGAAALPDSLYHSSKSLQALFTHLLDRISSEVSQNLEDQKDKTTPVFSKDAPFNQYAIPFSNPHHLPRICIALIGFDGTPKVVQKAMQVLPKEIALAWFSHEDGLPDQLHIARKAGYEVLLMIPMEPMYYPQNDPGSQTLLTGLSQKENLNRLHYHLAKAKGIIGVTNFLGSRFSVCEHDVTFILKELYSLGLMILDANTNPLSVISSIAKTINLPAARTNTQIDAIPEREVIEASLALLEQQALTEGQAIGYGFAYPLTIDVVAAWAASLKQRGILLAPLSAFVRENPS